MLGNGTFHDGASFRRLVWELVDRLDDSLGIDSRVSVRPDLSIELLEDGFSLNSTHRSHSFRGDEGMRLTGKLLSEGLGLAELAARVEDETGVPMATTMHRCNRLLDAGLLDEQPEGAQDQLGHWIPAPVGTF